MIISELQKLQNILDAVNALILICTHQHIVFMNHTTLEWLDFAFDSNQPINLADLLDTESAKFLVDNLPKLNAVNGSKSLNTQLVIKPSSTDAIRMTATIKPAPIETITDDRYWIITLTQQVDLVTPAAQIPPDKKTTLYHQPADEYALLSSLFDNHRFSDDELDQFFETLSAVIDYDSASIAIAKSDGLHIIAARGFPEKFMSKQIKINNPKLLAEKTEIVFEYAIGKVYYIPDTQKAENWLHVPEFDYMQSWMGIELHYQSETVGILNIDSSQPQAFTVEHGRYAIAVAQQAMLTLAHSRLYERFYNEYEEHRRLQTVLVRNLISTETMFAAQNLLYTSESFEESLPDLIKIVSYSMNNTQLIVVVFNLATNKLLHKRQAGVNTGDVWQIFTEVIGLPNLPDNQMPPHDIDLDNGSKTLTDGRHVEAAVIHQRGAIIALRDPQAEPFHDIDHELITTIASQMTIALKNEMLNAQLRQHTEHLERMVDRRTTQLSMERKWLQAILDSTAEGIFYMENFTLQYANPAFCKMVGYELEDLYGKPLSFLRVTTSEADVQNFDSLLDDPLSIQPGRSETRLRHSDGIEFYASIRYSLVGQPGEEPVRMVAIARDISQERNLYIQRARFIANAAHELRTPLTSLILRLHMLRRQPERINTHLENLDKVTGYLKDLVEELLTLSRFEQGSIVLDKSSHNLQNIVDRAIQEQLSFAQERQIEIEINLPDDPITIMADGIRLHQMMSNLILNSINYSEPEGTVIIILDTEIDAVGNANAIMYVIDHGAGIPADLVDDIFEPFARPSGGKRKETGMGLALVKEIANLHGGSVYCKSKLSEGTTFRVNLPLN